MTTVKELEPQSFFLELVTLIPDPPPDGRLIDESFEWFEQGTPSAGPGVFGRAWGDVEGGGNLISLKKAYVLIEQWRVE